jgi:hypothetical protein
MARRGGHAVSISSPLAANEKFRNIMPASVSISPFRRLWPLAGIIAGLLLINFLLRLPTSQVADWGQFAFYDPGTVLKGDLLLSKGYVPTVDFGYTHGLLSLLFGHIGFGLLGRTPTAFFVLTLATEAVMAWAIARILRATLTTRSPLAIFFMALPMAIMPAYLTLTHPLEAMFILLALAAQAEGKLPQALALMTACLFVKPSMAYVYGFLLTLLILWNMRSRKTWQIEPFIPALATLVILFAGLSQWMGVSPVLKTLFPTTGAATYAATGFGFFSADGRAFWLPANPLTDFLTPAAFFLLSAAAITIGALWALSKLFKTTPVDGTANPRHRAREILFTVGVLHTAFIFGFYGWTGSWTYYAYLPILGVTLLVSLLPHRMRTGAVVASVVILLLSHTQLIGDIAGCWNGKTRTQQSAGLYAYPVQMQEFEDALRATDAQPTLLMSNGYVGNLPVNISLPDAWFPEPGIPTASEIARVKAQAMQSQCVIVWWEYRRFDLWNSPEFSDVRSRFQPVFQNEYFTVLRTATPR